MNNVKFETMTGMVNKCIGVLTGIWTESCLKSNLVKLQLYITNLIIEAERGLSVQITKTVSEDTDHPKTKLMTILPTNLS